MNLFELVLKQMRQRFLSTLLTCLSIVLGMMLATTVLILEREGRSVFAQTDYGYELLVGPKGSDLSFVLNTVYHLGKSNGNIPYSLYEEIAQGDTMKDDGKENPFRGMAAWAVPYAVGDSYKGRHIVGTTVQLFGVDEEGKALQAEKVPTYGEGKVYRFAQGRAFAANRFEAVIGSEVAGALHLKIGDTFQATHGVPVGSFVPFDVHPEVWKVVGILEETHTASDKVLFIPLLTFYAIFEHEEGLESIDKIKGGTGAAVPAPAIVAASEPATEEAKAYVMNADGTITVKLPKKEWEISAILVHTQSASELMDMKFKMQNLPEADAVSPASVMGDFFDTFMPKITAMLLLISVMVMVVGGVSILVSIYNSVTARGREIAIMRALGATRVRILTAVCVEAGLVGVMGGVIGLAAGHGLAAAGSVYLQRWMGTGIGWWRFGGGEMVYLGVVVAVSLLAGFVPAMKAYGTPVAENLVG